MSDDLLPSPRPRSRRRRPRPLDVAIIGMACRFPGAPDVSAFWENVLRGLDATGDVPPGRWDPAVFFDPDAMDNDRVYCRRGGYLDEPVTFDPSRHGIMPIAVDGGEPEQFLVLDAALAALDDAGLGGGVPDGSRVEVVIGRGNYFNRGNLTRLQHGRVVAQTLGILRALHPEWTEADLEAVRHDLKSSLPPFEAGTVPGQLTNATAGRVAERLDLSGASVVVDAASASSLVALDLGARALVERRADLALVGGVYLQPDVDFPMVFCRLGALSRRGAARPFARSADGTLPGEGVGVVVLKRLRDAERDGDRVYAVVKGVGLASDGRGSGLAAPSAKGHVRAIRRAYRASEVDPATVALVEGHGLGVPASDRAELRALNATFPPAATGRRALGSLTSLIGHAMPAAGMAALIKSALALYHRVIPPTPHADEPHELLSEPGCPFALNPEARPWVHGATGFPRRAGVNAFGFAGANAHAVLEEHAASADGPGSGCMPRWETEAVLLGARDRAGWVEVARALLDWLDTGRNATVPLKDLAYTLNTGQSGFPFRVGLVASSTEDLRGKLRSTLAKVADERCRSLRDATGVYFWSEPLGGPGRLAFLYPGEGSQYPGMLADLCPHFPEVRAVLDTADRLYHERGIRPLPSEHLYGASRGGDGLWSLATAVNLVLSTQWGLHQLLRRLGLRPDAVVGHSSGEFCALAAAGVIRIDRGLEDRLGDLGNVFDELERSGRVPGASLVAVAGGRANVEAVCREVGASVVVAMDNCPHQVVLAGGPDAVGEAVSRLRAGGLFCEELPFDRAYHTPAFAAAVGPIRDFYRGLRMERPVVPLYSCATAGRAGDEAETVRRLAVDQWAAPVAFRETVEAMHADGVRLFVEVGARGSLTSYVEDTLRGRPHFAGTVNLPRRSGLTQLNHLVAALYAHGVDLRAEHLYTRRHPRRVDLSANIEAPAPGRVLQVGFPEMRLSESMVERLRNRPAAGSSETGAPHAANGRSVNRLDGPENGPSGWRVNGHHPTNGHDPGALGVARENGEAKTRPTANGTPATPSAADPATGPAQAEAAMLSFFETMGQFLETQRAVMRSYLGSRVADGAAEVERVVEPPYPIPQVAAEARDLPSPAEANGPSTPTAEPDLAEVLREQVSRRTGYPREMLALALDMEADLGIDSIKRAEILGELHDRGLVPAGVDMERLSRCRTLGQVVAALRPAGGPASTTPAGWAGEVEAFVPGREVVAVKRLDASTDPVAANHTLGGRRVSAVEPGRLGLPVIPFTVMAELLAQAAAVLVPGKAVVGFRELQANRWIVYEEGVPTVLEVRAVRDESRPDEVRAFLRTRGPGRDRRPGVDAPAVEGVVVFGDRRTPGPVAPGFHLEGAGPCRFTAEELYRDQWLFHGSALQAVDHVEQSSRHGIQGTLRVLPRRALFPEPAWPTLHTDPIVLDAFTHLLGCWGLEKRAGEEGDLMFPLRVGSLTIHGDDPAEGSRVDCRIRVREVTRHRVKVDADLVAPDGRVWVAIRDWEDWRFYWPGCYRDLFRQPDRFLVGEPVALPGPGVAADGSTVAVWLEPPADMGRPVWRDVLEWVQLGPEERRANRALGEAEPALTLRIWERVAAKEAARRVDLARGRPSVYPADLVIEAGPDGRPVPRSLVEPGRRELPSIAFGSAEGVAVALASADPARRIGVAVRRVETGPEARDERAERLACARAAASNALRTDGCSGDVLDADVESGDVLLRLPGAGVVRCGTARRGEYVWAWAVVEGGEA